MRLRVVTLSMLAALVLAAGARAQTNVENLPGDRLGAKFPFQKRFHLAPDQGTCSVPTKEFNLPAGSWTIETVTARTDQDAFHVPGVSLKTWVGGEDVFHTILLTQVGSFNGYGDGETRRLFQATHAVRLHHEADRDHPLVIDFAQFGSEECGGGFNDSLVVTISGYWRPADIKF